MTVELKSESNLEYRRNKAIESIMNTTNAMKYYTRQARNYRKNFYLDKINSTSLSSTENMLIIKKNTFDNNNVFHTIDDEVDCSHSIYTEQSRLHTNQYDALGLLTKSDDKNSSSLNAFEGRLSENERVYRLAQFLHQKVVSILDNKVTDKRSVLKELANLIIKNMYNTKFDIEEIINDHEKLRSKRLNKYGIEMTEIEQKLDNIKIGLEDIELYDTRSNIHPVKFFLETYKEFHDAGVIYQKDLADIDQKLLRNIKNKFQRKTTPDILGFETLNSLIPSREQQTIDMAYRIKTAKKRGDLNHRGNSLINNNKQLSAIVN